MRLLRLKLNTDFRSLKAGFQIDFRNLPLDSVSDLTGFQPFCFAGLNGSGKSNVLEALSVIFYYLEFCAVKYRPESFSKHFKRDVCQIDSFELNYLINSKDDYAKEMTRVKVVKEVGKEPEMTIEEYPFTNEVRFYNGISFQPPANRNEPAHAKEFLPDLVVGYSSGENEILSLPFIKTRLIHFDEYLEATKNNFDYKEPESSLLYIDEEMSQAVLLANLIFYDEKVLKPLKDELGIVGIKSFRMNLNFHPIHDLLGETSKDILTQFEKRLIGLKNCATSWYEFVDEDGLKTCFIDFHVDESTKDAFKANFDDAFDLFRVFQILYTLNNRIIDDNVKEEVYESKGFYTDGKMAQAGPADRVFYFLDYYIIKEVNKQGETKQLLLRNFSDGEHQFMHTMGICLMLHQKRSLLLLDEPETHFNPDWRSKFINVLRDSLAAGGGNNMLKEILLTSHSPFIISDCKQKNVFVFRNGKAANPKINTFGSSVDLILQDVFGVDHSISKYALDEIKSLLRKKNPAAIIEGSKLLGESYEKGFLYERIEELKSKKNKKK